MANRGQSDDQYRVPAVFPSPMHEPMTPLSRFMEVSLIKWYRRLLNNRHCPRFLPSSRHQFLQLQLARHRKPPVLSCRLPLLPHILTLVYPPSRHLLLRNQHRRHLLHPLHLPTLTQSLLVHRLPRQRA